MQKKLIALAVAGLASSAAFAQSNVTVYGVVDMYYGNASASNNANKNVVNQGGLAGSRLGFKGTEDLGNGLKALFTLEYALSPDSTAGQVGSGSAGVGGGNINARQQFVGLTGGFGTVLAGSLQTAGYDFSGATNAFHGSAINPLQTVTVGSSNVQGRAAGAFAAGNNTLIQSSSRASNALAYVSPSFGGVTVAYNHARVTETASNALNSDKSDASANLLSATYVQGPLTAGVIFTKLGAPTAITGAAGGAGTTGNNIKEWAVGASYDFGSVKLYGSYLTQKTDQTERDTAWQLSAAVPVTAAGKVLVGYAANDIKSDTAAGVNNSNNAKSWTLAYLHSLSKRTTAYAGYQNVSNGSSGLVGTGLQAPLSGAGSTNTVVGGNGGGSARAYVFGVNHSF